MAKRNGNGEGTRPRRRPDGRWEARYWDGDTRRSIYGQSRREVSERLREMMSVRGEEPAPKEVLAPETPALTYREFSKRYEETAKLTMKRRSFETHLEVNRLHLLPVFGDVTLRKIESSKIQSLYAKKIDQGLSQARVKRIHGVLNSTLNAALRWELIKSNPCSRVALPRVPVPEIRPLGLDEVRRLLDHASSDARHHALIVLGVTSGARWGELTGLFWSDLDLASRTMQIWRTLVRGRGGPSFDTPKTKRSRRTVRLSRLACDALNLHRERKREAGLPVDGERLVFTSRTGGPLNHSSFSRHTFKPLLKRAGLPDTSWHAATRHTCTCLLLLDRVDPKSICLQMGWSSVAFMLDTYASFMPGWTDDGAIDRILERP